MAEEREKVWAKTWLFARVAQDVEEPGDFSVFDLEPESIIICRSEAGELYAFFNVCQHRGARLLLCDLGPLETYTCPYHGWSYNNDGSLCQVPEEDKFSRGIPRDQLSLKPLRVESWAGAIWVCMDPGAPTLSEHLGPVMEMIEPFRPQDMTLVEDQSCRLECNWKAVASRGMLATPTAGDTFLKIEKGCLFLLTAYLCRH